MPEEAEGPATRELALGAGEQAQEREREPQDPLPLYTVDYLAIGMSKSRGAKWVLTASRLHQPC